ncbi:MAG: hypothetical protein H6727_03870 [Myxococcales bacterium]|nr:hypothetical protein [Myxococcales bacterium]
MIVRPNTPQTPAMPPQTSTPNDALADQIRCPGMSMLVREGLTVDKDGYVSYSDVLDKMQGKLGYDESFGKFLLGVFGNTSGTHGVKSVYDHVKNQRLNIWDLASPKSGGQHVRSLPFRREDGSVDSKQLNEALDRFAPDGKVTFDAVAKMINAYGQEGIVGDQPKGEGLKGKLGALGEQQTAGEVMLLFAAFAKRDGDGQIYMDRASFEQAYTGRIPSNFVASRDGLGQASVGSWTKWTAQTGASIVKDDANTALKNATGHLFRREDSTIEGADRALGLANKQGPDATMLEGISKTGVCPAMPGASQVSSPEAARNPQETAQIHQQLLETEMP